MNIISLFHLFMIKLIEITGCDRSAYETIISTGKFISFLEFIIFISMCFSDEINFYDIKFILVILIGLGITSLWFLIAYYLKKYF